MAGPAPRSHAGAPVKNLLRTSAHAAQRNIFWEAVSVIVNDSYYFHDSHYQCSPDQSLIHSPGVCMSKHFRRARLPRPTTLALALAAL
ncbi:MAG: hypothetical protein RSD99_30020, partial [Janthinobacterium sp.]